MVHFFDILVMIGRTATYTWFGTSFNVIVDGVFLVSSAVQYIKKTMMVVLFHIPRLISLLSNTLQTTFCPRFIQFHAQDHEAYMYVYHLVLRLVGLVTLGLAMPVSGVETTRLHSLLAELSLSLLAGLSQSLVPEPTLLFLIFESAGHCSCTSIPRDTRKTASLAQCQWLGEFISPRL